jgi:putative ATPase
MSDLFTKEEPHSQKHLSTPLAERVRPKTLDEFVGQDHLTQTGKPLKLMLESGEISSMILWGPPGVGKTTLARLVANHINAEFYQLSAVAAGVKDVREVIARAEKNLNRLDRRTILFIDEIHRFNKAQQDALLHSVEDGTITLIGATTENPSFEVISPLLSRCQVYVLDSLDRKALNAIIDHALSVDPVLSKLKIEIKDREYLMLLSGGDARKLLNGLENALRVTVPNPDKSVTITKLKIEEAFQRKYTLYDKEGEQHYDIISAFIKSMRGSDPDAAVYWMARMLDGGEDPKFIARRMIVLASEDIGNADPYALTLAVSCFTAIDYIGMPEARIVLAQTAAYLS